MSYYKVNVSGFPLDGKLHDVFGYVIKFNANLSDVATLPKMSWTNVCVGPVACEMAEPWVWRTNAKSPELFVELETESDARCNSLKDEASKCWDAFSALVNKKAQFMHLIGGHQEVLNRMREPMALREIQVRTLHDDYLAMMYAVGSSEIVRIAKLLAEIQQHKNPEVLGNMKLEDFMSGVTTELDEWQKKRYDEAIAGNFQLLQESFAPKGDVLL